jgi:hypothetical protein
MKRAAWFALALLLATPAVAEKWYEAYNRGVKAVNAKNYEAAAEALQRSITEMPTEGTSVRTRNEIIVYVPHFWLGIARFNLGDADAALREWRISEDQGAIQNTDYYARMRDWVARAQAEKQRMAKSASADSRKAADAAVSRAMSSQMDALAAGGDRSETYRQGQRKLQEAIDQFNKAGTDSRAYHRADETANQARELFVTAADDSRRAKAARPAAPAPKQAPPVQVSRVQVETQPRQQPAPPKTPPQTVPEAQKVQPAAPAPAVTPQQPPVESEALVAARIALQEYRGRAAAAAVQRRNDRTYQRALQNAGRDAAAMDAELQKNQDATTIKRVVDFVASKQRDLDTLTAEPAREATTVAPAAPAGASVAQLEAAYRAFAHGDLNASEQMLTQLIDTAPTAQAFLLRGCTRYTLATLSRASEAGMAAASSDFRAALKLNRTLRLDKNWFSPKLVAYFESLRVAPGK